MMQSWPGMCKTLGSVLPLPPPHQKGWHYLGRHITPSGYWFRGKDDFQIRHTHSSSEIPCLDSVPPVLTFKKVEGWQTIGAAKEKVAIAKPYLTEQNLKFWGEFQKVMWGNVNTRWILRY